MAHSANATDYRDKESMEVKQKAEEEKFRVLRQAIREM